VSPHEHQVLNQALDSLNNSFIDYYNSGEKRENGPFDYESIGKVIVARRFLAELLGITENFNFYLLPGESEVILEEGDNTEDWYNFTNKSTSENLTDQEKKTILEQILIPLDSVSGINDGDNACIRCARRMIAETIRFEPISKYRLMFEKEISPKYFNPT
jgi:hypothetical protein